MADNQATCEANGYIWDSRNQKCLKPNVEVTLGFYRSSGCDTKKGITKKIKKKLSRDVQDALLKLSV